MKRIFTGAYSRIAADSPVGFVCFALGADIFDAPFVAEIVRDAGSPQRVLTAKLTPGSALQDVLDAYLADESEWSPRIISVSRHEHDLGDFAVLELFYPISGNALVAAPKTVFQVYGNFDACRAWLAGWPANRVVQLSGAAMIASEATPISRAIH